MLANFFKKSDPLNFLTLVFLLFIYSGVRLFKQATPIDLEMGLLALGRFLLFSIFVLWVSFMISKNKLTPDSYYSLFVFVLLFGIFTDTMQLSKINLANLFILLAGNRIYSFYLKKNIALKLFDSGLLLGIAFLLYPASILYIILIYTGFILFVRTIEKEIFIPILGFLTPIFLVFMYYALFREVRDFVTIIELNIGFSTDMLLINKLLIPLVFLTILAVFAINMSIKKIYLSDNRSQKNIKLSITYIGLSTLVILLYTLNLNEGIVFLFFPLAVLIGNLIHLLKKKWLKNLILYSLFILSFSSLFLL